MHIDDDHPFSLQLIRSMAIAETVTDFENVLNKFEDFCSNNEYEKLENYFSSEWLTCKLMWVTAYLPSMQDRTNNIAESHFKTMKYTLLGGKKNRRMDRLIDIINNEVLLYYRVRLEASNSKRLPYKQSYNTLHSIIEKSLRTKVDIKDAYLGTASCSSSSGSGITYDINLQLMFCTCAMRANNFVWSHIRATAIN